MSILRRALGIDNFDVIPEKPSEASPSEVLEN